MDMGTWDHGLLNDEIENALGYSLKCHELKYSRFC